MDRRLAEPAEGERHAVGRRIRQAGEQRVDSTPRSCRPTRRPTRGAGTSRSGGCSGRSPRRRPCGGNPTRRSSPSGVGSITSSSTSRTPAAASELGREVDVHAQPSAATSAATSRRTSSRMTRTSWSGRPRGSSSGQSCAPQFRATTGHSSPHPMVTSNPAPLRQRSSVRTSAVGHRDRSMPTSRIATTTVGLMSSAGLGSGRHGAGQGGIGERVEEGRRHLGPAGVVDACKQDAVSCWHVHLARHAEYRRRDEGPSTRAAHRASRGTASAGASAPRRPG